MGGIHLNSTITIAPMAQNHIHNVALIHQKAFSRQTRSHEWITCNFQAYPHMRYFIAEKDNNIVGYIHWSEKSGFRKEVILELEQIAVDPQYQTQGVGTALILQSLPYIRNDLAQRDAKLRSILISTRTDNPAKKLYKKTLNAQPAATISNLFSADELLMIAHIPVE